MPGFLPRFHRAARDGNLEEVKRILGNSGVDVDEKYDVSLF